MRDILQILGMILGVIAIIIVDVTKIIMYKCEEEKLSTASLFEALSFGSAVGMAIIATFVLISSLF